MSEGKMSEYQRGFTEGRKLGYEFGKRMGALDERHNLTEFRIQTYRCELCDASFTGPHQAAQDAGWELGNGYAFCGKVSHN